METLAERPEVQHLQDRIAELEEALADACQDLRLTRAWLRLACQEESQPTRPPSRPPAMALQPQA